MLRRDIEGHLVFIPASLLGESADALVDPFVAVDFILSGSAGGAGGCGDRRERAAIEGGWFAGCAWRSEGEGVWGVECERAEGSGVQGCGEDDETICSLVYAWPLEGREFVGGD
jgi:hypothetical protein